MYNFYVKCFHWFYKRIEFFLIMMIVDITLDEYLIIIQCMYNVQCTYTVHLQCTLYNVQCNRQCALYSLHYPISESILLQQPNQKVRQ